MENLLNPICEENKLHQDNLSSVELRDLATTVFVSGVDGLEDNQNRNGVEVVRANGTPMSLPLSPIEFNHDDAFILEEHPNVLKPLEQQTVSDEAVILLNRILKSSEKSLKRCVLWNVFERSRKWKNTKRATELDLATTLISRVDQRPTLLHVFCRRLTEADIFSIIEKSLLDVKLPCDRSSLFRVTMKTEMPLKQLIGQIENFLTSSPEIQLNEHFTLAAENNLDRFGDKFFTPLVGNFADSEHFFNQWTSMSSATHFTFRIKEKKFLTVNVTYYNNDDMKGARFKTIVVEQFVSGSIPERHVTFGSPLVSSVVEYDIDEKLPFNRLPAICHDLMDFLEG